MTSFFDFVEQESHIIEPVQIALLRKIFLARMSMGGV